MSAIYENIGQILLMLVFLCFSGFFSASETAYFNLSRRQIEQLKHSHRRSEKIAALNASHPRRLLSALLLGNMTANVLYFAVSSIYVLHWQRQAGVAAAAVAGIISFAVLVLLGEVLPKSLSYVQSKSVSVFGAFILYAIVTVLRPVIKLFQFFIVTPALRLMIGTVKEPKPMSADEFRSLMERMKNSGYITAEEHRLADEIVGLNVLKVRHCLRPRVDMAVCDVTNSRESAIKFMREKKIVKVPVYYKKIDNIIGFVHLRDLLTKPELKVSQLVREGQFVPEQKTIESLLEFFRTTGTDTAIVVDEYGGIAGTIGLEDVAEEIFGPIETPRQAEPIEQIGPLKYRLSGNLALHDWARSFGVNLLQANFATVSGLVSYLLGRIPKPGDTARFGNLTFTVEQASKRRVQSVILSMEQNDL